MLCTIYIFWYYFPLLVASQEKGLNTNGGLVRQSLFIARMTTLANSAGYPPLGDTGEAADHQVSQEIMSLMKV